MRPPPQIVKAAAVYHLPTIGDKTYPGSADATIEGAFLPMDRHSHALEGGVYVDPHEFYADPNDDIRETDKLVIDSKTYFVKKTFVADFGRIRHKRVSLSTQK